MKMSKEDFRIMMLSNEQSDEIEGSETVKMANKVYDYNKLANGLIKQYPEGGKINGDIILDLLGGEQNIQKLHYIKDRVNVCLNKQGYWLSGTPKKGYVLDKRAIASKSNQEVLKEKTVVENQPKAEPALQSEAKQESSQEKVLSMLLDKIAKHPGEIIEFNNYLKSHGIGFKVVITGAELQVDKTEEVG